MTTENRTVNDLLNAVCSVAGAQAEIRAEARGEIPSDVRRAGWDAEAVERHVAHYGQAPDRAMRETLECRLRHLSEVEPAPGWQERAVARARRDGALPTA